MKQQSFSTPEQIPFAGLSFLWLELTNRCNLECVHCYSDSSPRSGDKDILTKTDYVRVIDEAAAAGCQQIQFIGGEPTLNRDLPEFMTHAADIGYEVIEVYSNLVRLPDNLIEAAQQTDAQFATSVYSSEPEVHDAVTGHRGSHKRTIANLRRLIELGIPVRASFIETELNAGHWQRTADFLEGLGVTQVGHDITRGFGRGAAQAKECDAGELCGQCWDERLCIAPDGGASPCIMSKAWPLGNIRQASVEQIAFSQETIKTRSWLHANQIDVDIDAIEAATGPRRPPGPGGPGGPGLPPLGPDQRPPCPPTLRDCPPTLPCAPGLAKKKCTPGSVTPPCAPDRGCKPGPAVKKRVPGSATPICGPDRGCKPGPDAGGVKRKVR
jgi:Radical SAM superfamily/4Fe-4S single cluster domain/Iron-sulfur cluster-binding domain